jgi:acetolactate synthase small subunit
MDEIIDFRTEEQKQYLKRPENKDLVSVIFVLSKKDIEKLTKEEEVSLIVIALTKEDIKKITEIKENYEFKDMNTTLTYMIRFCYDVEKKFNFFKEK